MKAVRLWLVLCALLPLAGAASPAADDPVAEFIRTNWVRTVRQAARDEGTVLGVPRPYTVPCASGSFQEMYYWDTYFTNAGLLADDRLEQARDNVENIASLIMRFGYMPNGNRTWYLGRSQPPFFSRMVAEVFARTGDAVWLARMYAAACREHAFWTERRMTPCGLARYGGELASEAARLDFGRTFCRRLSRPAPEDREQLLAYAVTFLAYAESGWDCTSRFPLNAHEYCPVDLNALLYGMEGDLADFATALGRPDEAAAWRKAAADRRAKMNELLWDEKLGQFCDYDFVRGKRSDFVSAASLYPLFTRLATPEQATRIRALLPRLECAHGLAASENRAAYDFQWDYPHGWAPLHWIAVRGFLNYGFEEDARRIAGKYVTTVQKVFAETGALWEKYDVTRGCVSVTKEYVSPQMLGWSAGVYLKCREVLKVP